MDFAYHGSRLVRGAIEPFAGAEEVSMKSTRSFVSVLACAAIVLSAVAASAITYPSFFGKFTSSRGRIINIPAIGNTACGNVVPLTNKTATQMVPPKSMTISPASKLRTRKVNTQPTMMTAGGKVTGGVDLGCVKHAAGVMIMTTAGAPAVGGAFTLPTMVWNRPLPTFGVTAVQVKYVTAIAQLATSFKITGPNPLTMIMEARAPGTMAMTSMNMQSTTGGTQATVNNLAPWLKFDKLVNIPASMRSGRAVGPAGRTAKFSWCPGGVTGCLKPGSGAGNAKAIVKYQGGGNQFGGTMSYIITTGPNTSSLALNPAGSMGAAAFLILAGSGSQPTGRGYAQLGSDMLMTGPQFSMHMEMTVIKPLAGMQKLITAVTNAIAPFPAATNFNYGFPWTTMRVIARNTGTALGNPMITTLTANAMGTAATSKGVKTAPAGPARDVLTPMGAGRNIQLVAGGIGITNLLTLGSRTAEIGTMLLPEPDMTLQMLAGVLALFGIAGWRARKSH